MGKQKLSVANWLAIVGMIGTLLAAGGTFATKYVWATKDEVRETRDGVRKCEADQRLTSQAVTYQAAQVRRVETRIENVQADIQTQNVNMARLLERFRVRAAKAPTHKPLPDLPESDPLEFE